MLRAGNRRQSTGRQISGIGRHDPAARARLLEGQRPFAVVLGCSDSRVPVELVFDQGPGDLFVVRVAGNLVDTMVIGSVEFATAVLGVRLVVVLGHTGCGAVRTTVESSLSQVPASSDGLRAIAERVRPAVDEALSSSGDASQAAGGNDAITAVAVRANIRRSAQHLRIESDLIRRLASDEGLVVVGAEYSLATGVVDFFDGVPPSHPGRSAADAG